MIDAGSSFSNFDWAVTSKTLLRKVGAEPSSFVASADTVGTLSTIKSFTGTITSNEPLLAATEHSVTEATPESVLGVPLIAVADGTALTDGLIWGIDRRKTFTVLRRDVTLDISPHAYFSSDSLAVRVTCRVGFAFTYGKAIAKVTTGGS